MGKIHLTKKLKILLLPVGLALMLFVIAACASDTPATHEPNGAPDSLDQSSLSNQQGVLDVSEADRLVAAQETVMVQLYQNALPSVVNLSLIHI